MVRKNDEASKLYSTVTTSLFVMKTNTRNSKAFTLRLQTSLDHAEKQRRGRAKALATALWFRDLKYRTGSSTAYKMEKLFESEGFGYDKKDNSYHRNKWRRYELGLNTPIERLVRRVDESFPGTARLLRHPFWKLIELPQWREKDSQVWLSQLPPDFQMAILVQNPASFSGEPIYKKLRKIHRPIFEKRADLDSMAAIVILLHEAIAKENDAAIRDFADSLLRVLLIICGFVPFNDLAQQLFDLIKSRVFDRIPQDKRHRDFASYDFLEAVATAEQLVLLLEDAGVLAGVEKKMNIQAKVDILGGKYWHLFPRDWRAIVQILYPRWRV